MKCPNKKPHGILPFPANCITLEEFWVEYSYYSRDDSYYSRDDRVNHRNSISTSQFVLKNEVLISAHKFPFFCLEELIFCRKISSELYSVNVRLYRYILHSTVVTSLISRPLVFYTDVEVWTRVSVGLKAGTKQGNGGRRPHPPPPPQARYPSCNNKQ